MVEESVDFVPSPPIRLRPPNVFELDKGKVIHRVHRREYRGNDFNPCKGGETRFAPIYDDDQNCIPTLYAADSVEAAIYESILHDVPLVADVKSVRLNTVLKYQLSDLLVSRPLRLASLRAPDLMKWGIRKTALIGSTSAHYKSTAIWAKCIHDQFHYLDGMLWTSNLSDPASSFLIFGDRVDSTDLRIQSARENTAESFLHFVRNAATRGDILLTI